MVTSQERAPRDPVRALWHAMSAHGRGLVAAGVLGAIASLSAVALLGTSGWLISKAAEHPPVLTLSVAAVMVRTLALSRAIARYAERLVGHDAAFRGLTELRVVVFGHLERLAPTGLAAFARGDLLSRLVADVDAALDLPLRVVLPWAQAVVVSILTVLFLGWLLPVSAAVVGLLALLGVVVVPWLSARTARAAEERVAPEKAAMTGAVVRALDAAPELAALGAAGSATGAVRRSDDALTRLSARGSYGLGLGSAAGVLIQGGAVVGALVGGIAAVADGRLEPVWLAVVALIPLALFDVLAGLPSSALAYQRLRGSARRIAEVDALPSPVPEPASPGPVPDGFAGLILRDVSARWPGDGRTDRATAISDVSLELPPGHRVAVVGPSGAGKSTLAAVVMGFLPYTGSARINGAELRDSDGDEVRARMGVLTQQAHVFDTSIAANVRLGNPVAEASRVDEVLTLAQLADWVGGLDEGAETPVGAFGVSVSGGERQRIALARLLLADRPLVLLDEPTEHLDAPTAEALTQTLATVLAESTVLLITHRLAGLEGFDRIAELHDGRIIASGTHAELMARDGWYADQWRAESEYLDLAHLLPTLPVGVGVAGPAAQVGPA